MGSTVIIVSHVSTDMSLFDMRVNIVAITPFSNSVIWQIQLLTHGMVAIGILCCVWVHTMDVVNLIMYLYIHIHLTQIFYYSKQGTNTQKQC